MGVEKWRKGSEYYEPDLNIDHKQETNHMVCTCGYVGKTNWVDFGMQYECGSSSGWTHDYQEVCPCCELPYFNPASYFEVDQALTEAKMNNVAGLVEYMGICVKHDQKDTIEIVDMLIEESTY